jgi:hypothetical protein
MGALLHEGKAGGSLMINTRILYSIHIYLFSSCLASFFPKAFLKAYTAMK